MAFVGAWYLARVDPQYQEKTVKPKIVISTTLQTVSLNFQFYKKINYRFIMKSPIST